MLLFVIIIKYLQCLINSRGGYAFIPKPALKRVGKVKRKLATDFKVGAVDDGAVDIALLSPITNRELSIDVV